jgi:hypothetical protein
LVRQRRVRGEGAEEEEGVGVKNESYPRSPIYIARLVGTVVVLHYPDHFCEHRHVVAHRGAAVLVTVPLGQLWQ